MSRRFQKKLRDGMVVETEKTAMDDQLCDTMKRTGAMIHFKNGLKLKRTNPAIIQEIRNRVKAKQTQAVSLRIPVADLEAAKKLAANTGIGYQTLLKELIHEGLRRAV